jgi:hypothetical protein
VAFLVRSRRPGIKCQRTRPRCEKHIRPRIGLPYAAGSTTKSISCCPSASISAMTHNRRCPARKEATASGLRGSGKMWRQRTCPSEFSADRTGPSIRSSATGNGNSAIRATRPVMTASMAAIATALHQRRRRLGAGVGTGVEVRQASRAAAVAKTLPLLPGTRLTGIPRSRSHNCAARTLTPR